MTIPTKIQISGRSNALFPPSEEAGGQPQEKHGYDFLEAPQVIESPASATSEDQRFAYEEQRFITFGLLRGQAVVIVTPETEEEIRVISIQKAERHEDKIYHTNI